jgi:hypothetical protein
VRFSAAASPFPLEWRGAIAKKSMAKKKPKTPTPPRPVQAPRRRDDSKGPALDFGLGHRNALYLFSAAGIVALIVVVLIVALGGGGGGKTNDAKVASAMTAAGCTFKTVKAYVPPGQGTHVNSLTKKLPWNTNPPSNGQHYPLWAVWGFWTDAINPRQVVHNEEHGGVILWWGSDVPQSTVEALKSFYDKQPDGTFGTKYPELGSKIAVTAWTGDPNRYQRNNYYGFGHIGVCPTWNAKVETAFTAFRDTYRGKGPEGIPLSQDNPGMGPTSG